VGSIFQIPLKSNVGAPQISTLEQADRSQTLGQKVIRAEEQSQLFFSPIYEKKAQNTLRSTTVLS